MGLPVRRLDADAVAVQGSTSEASVMRLPVRRLDAVGTSGLHQLSISSKPDARSMGLAAPASRISRDPTITTELLARVTAV